MADHPKQLTPAQLAELRSASLADYDARCPDCGARFTPSAWEWHAPNCPQEGTTA